MGCAYQLYAGFSLLSPLLAAFPGTTEFVLRSDSSEPGMAEPESLEPGMTGVECAKYFVTHVV
jgi:hypothetical protein